MLWNSLKQTLKNNFPFLGKRDKGFYRLQKELNIRFKKPDLIEQAFYHKSYRTEKKIKIDNERLEFLGDAVLEIGISDFLYQTLPDASEGILSQIRADAVNKDQLAKIAQKIGLGDFIFMGRGEILSRGHSKPALLADCLEAFLGAYYLDAGIRKTFRLIRKLWTPYLKEMTENAGKTNYKSLLQEYSQKRYKELPVYELLETSGYDHEKKFRVCVHVGGERYGPIDAFKKKDAEKTLAEMAYRSLSSSEEES